jgi:malate dehydrogenase
MTKTPITVTLTGAGGQIGYAALFRIAAGDMLGADQPVSLRLLEIPQGMRAAEGAALELTDCAFPLLAGVEISDAPEVAFDGANVAMLIGSRPRTAGMERGDLLEANGAIFGPQGRAIGARAADDVRVIVVGNPANTNALIAQQHAPEVPAERFTALTRLDHNRAVGLLAAEAGAGVAQIDGVTIWGNHSATQYPDLSHATVGGAPALEAVDPQWARGAYAAIEHVRDWMLGTGERRTSAAVVSHGEYGVPEGLISSFPVRSEGGAWRVVEGLAVDEFSRQRIDASVAELVSERDAVRQLGLI